MKFSLGSNRRLAIFATGSDGTPYPKSVGIACTPRQSVDVIEQMTTAGNSSLSYRRGPVGSGAPTGASEAAAGGVSALPSARPAWPGTAT